MSEPIVVNGVRMPAFLYGTAWKEDDTARCVTQALEAGFKGIDTANQRRHYHEAAVGEAIQGRPRDSLFLQTKFTHVGGQDRRLPYDPTAPVSTQVVQSFESSLKHLGTNIIDSYLLHGPSTRFGLAPEDMEAWTAMEALHASERVRLIGVSNVSREQLEFLSSRAKTPPAVVQNRCFARTGWDASVRAWCREHGAAYQGFSLLTANMHEIGSETIRAIARRVGHTPAQVVFRFSMQVGMVCLTGSTSAEHLAQDLRCNDFILQASDLRDIERVSI